MIQNTRSTGPCWSKREWLEGAASDLVTNGRGRSLLQRAMTDLTAHDLLLHQRAYDANPANRRIAVYRVAQMRLLSAAPGANISDAW